MVFELEFSAKADADIERHKKAGNRAIIHKIFNLLNELTEHPFSGIGKPEPLKHNLSGYWSRRINREHRLIYRVDKKIVYVLSAYGHY